MLLFKQRGFRDCKISHHRRWERCMPLQPWSWAGGEHSGKTKNILRTGSSSNVAMARTIQLNSVLCRRGTCWLLLASGWQCFQQLWCKHNFYCTFRYKLMYRLPSQWLSCNNSNLWRLCSSFLVLYGRRTRNLAHQLLSCSLSKI